MPGKSAAGGAEAGELARGRAAQPASRYLAKAEGALSDVARWAMPKPCSQSAPSSN